MTYSVDLDLFLQHLVELPLAQSGADALQLGDIVGQKFDGLYLVFQEIVFYEVFKLPKQKKIIARGPPLRKGTLPSGTSHSS